MIFQDVRKYFPTFDRAQRQCQNIILITFWSQFSVYAFNSILVLFLTRPLWANGLAYSEAKAYAFIGVAHAMGYLMPMLGGFMADKVLGIRRSILLGSVFLAIAYLLVMLSGYSIQSFGDKLFLAAYAIVPVTNSLLMGTTSSMVSHIYSDEAIKAKSAMTYYYIAINVGALLATLIAPSLLDSRYGPLSIFTLAFIGKSIAALNFIKRYTLYENVLWGKDLFPISLKSVGILLLYIVVIYILTLFAFTYVFGAGTFIIFCCVLGCAWFFYQTLSLQGTIRLKQMAALLLIFEAVIFFIIYTQMNSTMILFAKHNSNLNLLGLSVSPAQYQMLNPIVILLVGSQLPRFYQYFPRFTIPYQFAAGVLLSGFGLLILAFAAEWAHNGIVEGNYIALTYLLLSISELWISAVGLSMIGLYCDQQTIAFAMGVWYLASSLAHAISGKLAGLVAIPQNMGDAVLRLSYYKAYYLSLGFVALGFGVLMYFIAIALHQAMDRKGIELA